MPGPHSVAQRQRWPGVQLYDWSVLMTFWWRRLLGVAVVVTAGGANTFALPAAGGASPELRASHAVCSRILFVGARGSGQPTGQWQGYGPEVHAFRQELRRLETKRSGWMNESWVDYPAHSTERLTRPRLDSQDLWGYWEQAKSYFDGLDKGVSETVRLLKDAARKCPTQHVVLAGYSQGAMVMQRAAARLQADGRTDIVARIAGLVLFGNGDRPPDAGTRIEGSPRAGAAGQGIAQAFGKHPPVPRNLTERTWDVCSKNDLICDWRGAWSIKNRSEALAVHGTYGKWKSNETTAKYLINYVNSRTGCRALDPLTRSRDVPEWVGTPWLVPETEQPGHYGIYANIRNRAPDERLIYAYTMNVVKQSADWKTCSRYFTGAVPVQGNPTLGSTTFTNRRVGLFTAFHGPDADYTCTVLVAASSATMPNGTGISEPRCFWGNGQPAPPFLVAQY